MTIAIAIMVFINVVALMYIGIIIFEIRDKTNNVYPELMKIINDQQNVLRVTLDSINSWSDICADIVDHIERVEDMEGDIKDIFEWIHSIDDNVANMRMDIQETDTKLGDLMTAHDRNVLMFSDALQSLQRDILDIKNKSPEKYNFDDLNLITVNTAANGDTDGDIPMNTVRENNKDVYALYEEIVDRAKKKYETILKEKDHEGEDEDDDNRDE